MADMEIAKAIALLSKVSADTAQRVAALEKAGGSVAAAATKGPRKVKEKAKEVVVTDFGRKAEQDLSKLGGDDELIRDNEKQKNQNNDLLKLLGLAGAAALALKFLFDGEGFTGLVQGFQKAFKIVGKQVARIKGAFGRITNRMKSFGKNIKNIASKAKNLASKAASRVGKMAKSIGSGIKSIGAKTKDFFKNIKGVNFKSVMDDIGAKIGTFMDDLGKGMSAAVNKLKGGGGSKPAASKPSTTSAAPPKKQSWWSKGWEGAKNLGKKVVDVGKNVGGKVVQGAKAAGSFAKDWVLKPLGKGLKALKPLQIVKGLAKTPLLAPLLESFFMAGDINDLIAKSMTGDIDPKQLNEKVGTRFIKGITGLIGGAGGAMLGSALGSFVPVVGNIIGAISGGVLGDMAGRAIGDLIAPMLGDKTASLGEWALSSPLFSRPDGELKMDFAEALKRTDDNATEITDGIITKDGQLIKPHADDTLYAMKEGGPLVDLILKGTDRQIQALTALTNTSSDLLSRQVDLANETNLLLEQVLEKTGGNVVMNNVSKTNISTPDQSLRRLQLDYSY